jgi:hypothetical protein
MLFAARFRLSLNRKWGLPMEDVTEYLANAETCLRMAVNARTETVRAHVIELAKQWTRLAAEHENLVRARTSHAPNRQH